MKSFIIQLMSKNVSDVLTCWLVKDAVYFDAMKVTVRMLENYLAQFY